MLSLYIELYYFNGSGATDITVTSAQPHLYVVSVPDTETGVTEVVISDETWNPRL